MTDLTKFSKFSDLPKELRIDIWEHVAFTKRILELNYCVVDQIFSIPGPPPAILHTNQESREVALRFYNKSFGTINQPAEIYFNPAVDTIYLSSRQYIDEVTAIAKHFIAHNMVAYEHQIQSIAIGEKFWSGSRHILPFRLSEALGNISRFQSAFPHLHEVILVKGSPSQEEVVSWDHYSGISLFPSNMDNICDELLEIVLLAFELDAAARPDGRKLKAVVMEHPTYHPPTPICF